MTRWVDSTAALEVVTPDGTELLRVVKNGVSKAVRTGDIADADAAAAIAAHVAQSDPHTQYLKESGARAELGLDTTDSPQFTAINLGHASDATLTRSAAGRLAVEGTELAFARYYDVNSPAYAGSIQAAIDAAAAAGGGTVIVPCGTYALGSTGLTMKDNVIVQGLGWPTITYTGSGTMFGASSSAPLYRSGVRDVQINEGSSCAKVFDLLSAYQCDFRNIRLLGTCATSVVFNLESNSSGSTNPDGNRNVVFNYFANILHDGSCGTLVRMYGTGTDGVSVTAPVTLNTFVSVNARSVKVIGIEFARWCDSNYFAGITRISLTADNAIGVIHNSLNVAVNCGVYANNFDHLAVDTFGNPGVYNGRVGLKMNHTKQNYVGILYQYPVAEGGSFLTTANSTCYMVRMVNETSNNFDVYSDNNFFDKVEVTATGRVNFGDDVTITHATDQLSFTGAGAAGYGFDSLITASRAGVGFLANNTTNAASNTGMILRSARATSAASDDIHMLFQLKDSAGNQTDYARIKGLIESNTDTSETGQIRFGVSVSGTVADRYIMSATAFSPNSNGQVALGTTALRFGAAHLNPVAVASLPTGAAGSVAFASNGRKNGEGAGAGTGVLCFHDGTAWRACDTGATVAA